MLKKLKSPHWFVPKINATAKAMLTEQMAIMLKSGLTVIDALTIIGDSSIGTLKKVIWSLRDSINAGNTLSGAMSQNSGSFSNLIIKTVEAGEESGTLEEKLRTLSIQLTKEKVLAGKIKSAMLYPIIVMSAAFLMGLGMAFFILPKITPLFTGMKVELPLSTRILLQFSDLVQFHGLAFFGSIIGAILVLVVLGKRQFSRPVTHYLLLHTPLIKGISSNANLARFCRTLSTLLQSGLNIDEALNITQESSDNYYYRRALKDINQHIGKGAKLSENLLMHQNYFPDMVMKMVAVGEQSGRLSETLEYLADYYDGKVDVATKNLTILIEPILLLFIGLVVAFLALSIITPIYNITGNINN